VFIKNVDDENQKKIATVLVEKAIDNDTLNYIRNVAL